MENLEHAMKWVVYAAALTGAPLMLAAVRAVAGRTGYLTISRIALWLFTAGVLTATAFVFTNSDIGQTLSFIGFREPTRQTWIEGLAAGAICFFAAGAIIAIRAKRVGFTEKDDQSLEQIADQPFLGRALIVLTAAITEEALYRGVGIGVGAIIFGNVWIAAAVSLAAFIVTHLGSWSARHLPLVTILGSVLTGLYLLSGDLASVMIAHFIADAGIILAPLMKRRR